MLIQSDGVAFVDNDSQESWYNFGAGDKIAVYFDGRANSIKFYVNGNENFTASLDRDPDVNYVIAVAFSTESSSAKTVIELSSSVEPPAGLDLLGSTSVDVGTSESWGYKFQVKPKFSQQNKLCFLNMLNEE